MIRSLAFAVSTLLVASAAFAHGATPRNINLRCTLDETTTLLLSQADARVYYAAADDVATLQLDGFQTYRCPYCWSFSGTLHGQRYVGATHGQLNHDRHMWDISLDLQIDGGAHQTLSCDVPEPGAD